MQQNQYSSFRWVIQSVLMTIQVGLGVNFMSPSPLFTIIMNDYDISRSSVSLLVSATIIVITIALIPGSLLIAKIGSKRAMTIAGLFMSAHLLTPFTDSFMLLVTLRLIFGIGVAISIPTTSAIIMEWFKPNELPLLNGINEAGRALGVSIGVFIAAPIANIVGWEMAFFWFGTIPLVGTVIWMIGGRNNNTPTNVESSFSIRDNLPLILNRNTLLIAAGMAGGFSIFFGFSSWLPTYYNEIRGMTLEKGSSLVAVMALMGALLNPVSGLIQSKFGRRKPMLIASGLLLPLFALGSFLLTNQIIIIMCMVGLGATFSIFIVVSLTIPMELPGVSAVKVGIVTAAVISMGNLAGVMSPIFIGSLTDFMDSYIPAFSIVTLAPLTLVVAGVFLPETGQRVASKFRERHH